MICRMANPADLPIDGRTQRSERSREAIVRAMLDLIGEGVLAPTAQQVAVRADVGVRTVFRHFSDMETLFATMNEQLTEELNPLFVDEPQSGPLAERAETLVARRFEIFERLTPYYRASALARARSAFLREQHDRDVRVLRRDLRRWLPELQDAAPAIGDALEVALSFEAFERLRIDQRLGIKRARAALDEIVAGLLRALVDA